MELWIIISLLSAFVFSIKDILAKKFFQDKDISPTQLVFEQHFIGIALLFLVFLPQIDFYSFFSNWWLFLLKAFSVGLSTFLYFELLKKYEITLVAPLINLSVFFLLILSTIFLGEKITLLQIIGIIITILATYSLEIVVGHHHKKKPHKFHFNFLKGRDSFFFFSALIMLFAFSTAALFDKLILTSGVNPYTNAYFTSLFLFTGLIFYYAKQHNLHKSLKNLIYQPETFLISFLTFLSNLIILFAIAIPGALVSLIIALRRTSTLMTSLLGGILFHEKHLGKKFGATVLMLLGVILIIL